MGFCLAGNSVSPKNAERNNIQDAMSHKPLIKPGAFLTPEGVCYRVWAPEKQRVDVVLFDENGGGPARTVPLTMQANDYFEGLDPAGTAGDRYKFRLDGEEGKPFPIPPRASNPKAYTALRWSSDRHLRLGKTTRIGATTRWRTWSSTNCTSARSLRQELTSPPSKSWTTSPRSARTPSRSCRWRIFLAAGIGGTMA